MSLLLAIDVGTLSARAGLFDASGRLVTARSHPFELLRPAENHAVYRMDEIWAAVCAAIRAAIADAPGAAAAIAGVAVDATSSTYFEAKAGRRCKAMRTWSAGWTIAASARQRRSEHPATVIWIMSAARSRRRCICPRFSG